MRATLLKIFILFFFFGIYTETNAQFNSLVGMDNLLFTDPDIEVKKELNAFNSVNEQEIEDFNRQFNAKNLNYLFLDAQ